MYPSARPHCGQHKLHRVAPALRGRASRPSERAEGRRGRKPHASTVSSKPQCEAAAWTRWKRSHAPATHLPRPRRDAREKAADVELVPQLLVQLVADVALLDLALHRVGPLGRLPLRLLPQLDAAVLRSRGGTRTAHGAKGGTDPTGAAPRPAPGAPVCSSRRPARLPAGSTA